MDLPLDRGATRVSGDRASPRLGLALRGAPISEHLMRVLEQLERLQREPPPTWQLRSGLPKD
jgi:hypothetical protein